MSIAVGIDRLYPCTVHTCVQPLSCTAVRSLPVLPALLLMPLCGWAEVSSWGQETRVAESYTQAEKCACRSLGSDSPIPGEDPVEAALDNLMASGIAVVASAGNDGGAGPCALHVSTGTLNRSLIMNSSHAISSHEGRQGNLMISQRRSAGLWWARRRSLRGPSASLLLSARPWR